jgi:hypothetical protein
MMESAQDRLDLLSSLGDDITYNGSAIKAVFDSTYYEATMGDFGVEGAQAGMMCRDIDLTAPVHGDVVVVRGVSYVVIGVKPDGTGMTEFELELS